MNCEHQNLIPIEYIYGKRSYSDGVKESSGAYIDWTSNIINAHVCRVTKLYCPKCQNIWRVPSDTPDQLP